MNTGQRQTVLFFMATKHLSYLKNWVSVKVSANAYKYIGMGYYFLGNYSETINFWQKSLTSFEAINDKVGISNILSNIGALYANQGDDVKALEFPPAIIKGSRRVKRHPHG